MDKVAGITNYFLASLDDFSAKHKVLHVRRILQMSPWRRNNCARLCNRHVTDCPAGLDSYHSRGFRGPVL
ncbi:hypothetical protein Y1Q_0014212 [Alligator mississippiensis]|uniref:Uncharacterized protein n=1 Tax=Alligator mississippiensis TaxID=8496 RepID=A0A151MU80_ALLMI|nr:hypothetical protein Y1Q_0014212 [Alligator mississippiensis]